MYYLAFIDDRMCIAKRLIKNKSEKKSKMYDCLRYEHICIQKADSGTANHPVSESERSNDGKEAADKRKCGASDDTPQEDDQA